ncbi:hypothetical protein [Paraburkholderia sp. HD33-4]|uniref:hypothetical protein n=1 Tax=Paraburkholderia sp. HD33-4 TaxID=2883242 RepID=UPI001F2BB580|nr:hypothetical protein [Paraburkholderia sp. HD33-4]
MKIHLRPVFWVETVLASMTAFLAVLTAIWPDWIEGVSGFDPDRHNGSFEWGIVIVLFATTLVLVIMARREWRRRWTPSS